MVDLSTLKVGDTVKFRDGTSAKIQNVSARKEGCIFPYEITFENGKKITYTKEGFFYPDGDVNDRDIIAITKGESTMICNHVDLHNIAEGDVVYFEDGSEYVVDDAATFTDSYVILDLYDYGRFKFNYDGTKFEENENVSNIVHVLHGTTVPKDPTKTVDQADPVNHPSHYTSGGIECIEAIKASMTTEAYKGFLKGNILKYLWRYEKKEKPAEDLKKARIYLDWLIKEVEDVKDK